MDIVLERILSLIPRKENGGFEHGALKMFAASIGLKSGNVVSDWINGRSKSYTKKLHEISAAYGVSVEWLRGKTDDPTPKNISLKSEGAELVEYLQELAERSEMRMLFSVSKGATKEQIEAIVHMIEAMQGGSNNE